MRDISDLNIDIPLLKKQIRALNKSNCDPEMKLGLENLLEAILEAAEEDEENEN